MHAITVAVVVVGLMSTACASQPRGVDAEPRGPGARIGHGLAYDEVRRVTVLFGGVNEDGASLGDTWLWDGATWRRVATTGPAPRKWPTLVFAAGRGSVILFGGRVGTGANVHSAADTWEWNGSGWTQLPDSGPPGRDHAAMAYQRDRARIVLHGGWSGTAFLGDTWELTSAGWRRFGDQGPAARAAHSLAHDELRNETILFGGRAPGFLNDTWALRGERWIRLAPATLPPARAFHAAAYHARSSAIVLSGGRDGPQLYGDTWRWQGDRWVEQRGSAPAPRGIYALVDDRDRGELVFHGGGSMPEERWVLFDETWVLRDGTWIQVWPR